VDQLFTQPGPINSPTAPSPLEERFRPSPRFVEVVGEIAMQLGVDASPLIRGNVIELFGEKFAFIHFGADDPTGLTLFMQTAELKDEPGMDVARSLLEYNATTSAGAAGYFAIVPRTNTVVCCWRFDIEKLEKPAEHLLLIISHIATSAGESRRAAEQIFQRPSH
jgi:hypothetical protein